MSIMLVLLLLLIRRCVLALCLSQSLSVSVSVSVSVCLSLCLSLEFSCTKLCPEKAQQLLYLNFPWTAPEAVENSTYHPLEPTLKPSLVHSGDYQSALLRLHQVTCHTLFVDWWSFHVRRDVSNLSPTHCFICISHSSFVHVYEWRM